MTPFGAFLDKGIAVLASSNYDIVEGLRSLTWSNLLTNIGLYVLVVYWGSYLVLGVIFSQIDKIKLKGDPIQSLIKAIELEESYAMPVQQDSNASFTRGPSGFPASPNVRSLQICVDASSFADLRSVPQVLPSRFRRKNRSQQKKKCCASIRNKIQREMRHRPTNCVAVFCLFSCR